jgi:lysophospholipase L1-like esterase
LRIVLRLTVLVVALGLALVGAEYAARFSLRNVKSSGNATDFITAHSPAPAIVDNHLGFREREIPPRQPGRYRIVVVGDSFTWGQGVEAPERFSNQMESALGPSYEVFNFGRPGNNLPEHLAVLQQALPVSPDFVLVQLYINDFETRAMKRPQPYALLPRGTDRSFRRRFVTYDLLSKQWALLQETVGLCESYQAYMARNLLDPAAPQAVETVASLHRIIDAAAAAKVPLGFVIFPAYDRMGPRGSNYPFGYLHDRIRGVCADAKVPCLDLLGVFSQVPDPRTLWVSPFDAHPSAAAHHRAATEIVAHFAPVWRR